MTKLNFFTIIQYEEEAVWLRKMQKQGWKFSGVTMPFFYHFEKCEPQDFVYQLDYNKDGSNPEYVKMFEDCGWEYITDCMGYSYFRKPAEALTSSEADGTNEIFCDYESRLDMLRRIFRGRMLPLFVIFFGTIATQLPMSIIRRGLSNSVTIMWIVLALLYLWIFASYTKKYISFKRRCHK